MACPWSTWQPATIGFCENALCSWVKTPANTWSNLAYLAAGVCVLRCARRDGHAILAPIGWIGILVGIGSFFFHASGTFAGEYVDVGAMFLFAAYALTFNAWRLGWVSQTWIARFFAIAVAFPLVMLAVYHAAGILIFTGMVTAVGLMEIRASRHPRRAPATPIKRRYLYYLCLAFSVAFLAWTLDIRGIVCDPDNHWLQGHAVWHVVNSSCFYFLYRYYQQFVPNKLV